MTLKMCPVCGDDLTPHCQQSSQCDLVECAGCFAIGTLGGRYWRQTSTSWYVSTSKVVVNKDDPRHPS